jgi:hypothetical protein
MKTTQTTAALLAVVVLTLGAGFAAGMLAHRVCSGQSDTASAIGGSAPIVRASADGAALVDQLQLTPQQRERMRTIWEQVRGDVQGCYQDAQDLQRRRQQALVAMLSDEQKAEFDRICTEYSAKFTQLTKRRDQAFQNAVQQTRKLLNDSQRQRYEQILHDRLGNEWHQAESMRPQSPPLDAGL